MQAKLPDINARLVRHTNAIFNAYDKGDFAKAAVSFEAINALLPEDYQLKIDSKSYQDSIAPIKSFECSSCNKESLETVIIPYMHTLDNAGALLVGNQILKVWRCPLCNNLNSFHHTKKFITQNNKHSFFKVIPEPPSKKGMYDRIGHEQKWLEWFDICFKEIERQISLYRTEYAAQNSGDFVMEDIPE